MGRKFQPLEQAGSWDEFRAGMERESAAADNPWLRLLWIAGGLLFGTGLISSAYAFQDHHWWLWLVMLTPLAIAGFLASLALDRADRIHARAIELERLENAWLAHPDRRSPAMYPHGGSPAL